MNFAGEVIGFSRFVYYVMLKLKPIFYRSSNASNKL